MQRAVRNRSPIALRLTLSSFASALQEANPASNVQWCDQLGCATRKTGKLWENTAKTPGYSVGCNVHVACLDDVVSVPGPPMITYILRIQRSTRQSSTHPTSPALQPPLVC